MALSSVCGVTGAQGGGGRSGEGGGGEKGISGMGMGETENTGGGRRWS